MTNINTLVHQFLDRNPKITDNLAEGIINTRALASRIIRDLNMTATEHAVTSAIRRYELPENKKKEHEWVFNDAKISTKSRLIKIVIYRNFNFLENFLPELHKRIHPTPGDILRLNESRKKVTIVIDHTKKDEILKLIPKSQLIEVKENMAEILILFGSHPGPGGARAMILNELGVHKIPIDEVTSSLPEFMLLLNHQSIGKAHELLLDLFYK